jgi:hypothetical protein
MMINLDEMYRTALINRQSAEPIDVMRDGSEIIHLAQADDFTQMATEMAGGTEPPGATPMTLKEFATSAADVPAGLLKGAVQGTIGLPGDIESLGRATGKAIPGLAPSQATLFPVVNAIRTLKNIPGGALDRFLKGLEEETVLPTTEDIKRFFDKTLGIPLVPAGASERRTKGAKIPEVIGEFGGAGQTVIEGSRAAARGARQIGREIATEPPTGAVQMAPTPVQAPKSEIGFYSAVEETVANLPQAKGTGQQFLAQISKTAGVKPDEIKWTGLDEFLKGKKSVTKAEVQDYLAANRVDVQEVRLGRTPAMVQAERDAAFGAYDRGEITLEQRNAILEQSEPATTRHHLGAYKGIATEIPGGENYREILLTLPQRTDPFDPSKVQIYRNRMSQTQGNFTIKYGDNVVGPFADELNVGNDYSGLNDQEIIGVAKRMYEQGNELSGIKPMSGAFKSTHYDQPNILAHMRVNDRVVDGKKTLFIEEIQSDWHQAGRKKGYADAGKPYEVFDPKDGNVIATFKTEQEAKAYADELGPNVDYAKSEGVPDAPFKTSWHELSLKRAIQEASEKGYDQIAFTTGKTQAERYDLSKQVDSVLYFPDTKTVVAYKNKEIAAEKRLQNESELEEVIGKDAARKLLEQPTKSLVNARGDKAQTISGVDLQVGGEGMKGFYDNILPKSLEKLGKKFDAKVGKTEMDGVEVWQMGITPKMRESAMSKGQPLFVAPVVAPGMMQDEESK